MKKLFFIFVIMSFLLVACNGSSAKSADPEHEITDPTKPIEVTVGSEFTIVVKTNSSPTYHWELAEALDTNIVQYVWKDHVDDKPDTSGSPGKDIWRFQAVGAGQTTIKLGYYVGMTEEARQLPVYTIIVK